MWGWGVGREGVGSGEWERSACVVIGRPGSSVDELGIGDLGTDWVRGKK